MAPRTKPADERRRDLLDAGLAVFAAQGVPATVVEDITRRAGVAKGTFYLYFDSKERLLAALQERFEADMVGRIEAAVAAAGDDWGAKLDAWVGACFRDYPAEAALHDVLFHPAATAATEAARADRAGRPTLVTSLRRLIAAGVRAGAYRVADPDLTATFLCHALHGAYDRIWHDPGPLDTARLTSVGRELVRRALGCADAAGPPGAAGPEDGAARRDPLPARGVGPPAPVA
jgi:AcrR family transcriptional regulator